MSKKFIQVEPTEAMKKFVWSPSKLATYVGNLKWVNGCGVRTYLDYFAGPTFDVSRHHFTFGTYVHEVLELYHDYDEQVPYEQVLKWAKDLWIASIYKKSIAKKFGQHLVDILEENKKVSFSDIDRDGKFTFEDLDICYPRINMIDELLRGTATRWMFLGYGSAEEEREYNCKAYNIFEEYYALPYIKPASLEQFLQLDFDGVIVRGRVDRIDRIIDNKYCVIDYKTSKKIKKKKELNEDFQMICYHHAAKKEFNVSDKDVEVGLFFLCPQEKINGSYQPKPMILSKTQITESDLETAHNVILEADRRLKSGYFHYVADNGKWQCPYCDHKDYCGR